MPRPRCTTPLWNKPLPNGDVFYAFKIGQEFYAFIHRVSQFGLRWRRCDHRHRSPRGRELVSKRVSQALKTQTEFTASEWMSFGLHATADDVIWVDDDVCCFQPVVPRHHLQVACTASKHPKALDQGFADRELAQTEAPRSLISFKKRFLSH